MASAVLGWAAAAVAWFLARYVGVVVVLYALSTASELAGFAARVLVSWLALILVALYGVATSVVLRLTGGDRWQSAQWATARAFKYVMAAAAGITFVVDDPRDVLLTTRPAVFVGNHQSALDVLMLGCMFPRFCSVTAKAQLRLYPFLGWFMRLSGTVFIDRANSQDARQAMSGAADAIRSRRQSVYIFPEGTRSHSVEPTLLPFKKGAFHLAVQAGVPIVPVVVANYSHIYLTAKFRFRTGRIPVKVLDPIPTVGLTADDVADLTTRVRDLMLRELIALTAEARSLSRKDASLAAPVKAEKAVSSSIKVAAA
ncbi:1-acylglycerol-3-phosphate acyltransferase [Grosmannia clavigera kw1407]|uniref:1-acyl-sn-glycerol-3-phosphate acyltransferase n=1 Tax=Grosmannia clavigera (strain kw1407 / UAMH 11150) TaxID=655863 RepID=F0XQ83_GROCL|nr:1-acylglycerol-3-phosphate acyltransferase [Grosmannia clavigera kw1407]EFX00370.1 1-acylglycerol-3-phosphate acyltransferase [Grosmannia clavigera kw1407]